MGKKNYLVYFLKMGAHRVPISPKGIIGPEGARIKRKLTKWNRANMCPSIIHACPEGAII